MAVRKHGRVLVQNRLHYCFQHPRPLAMNYSYMKYTAFEAFLDVIRNELFDVFRRKRMQVERAVDRQRDGLIVIAHEI